MRRLATLLSLLTLLVAAPAVAQIDIEMAFDPGEVAPGETVIFSGSLISSFDFDLDAEFEFSASFNDYAFGPLTIELPVCAAQTMDFAVPLPVPSGMCAGDLAISVTVTAEGMSDTATATLTITGDEEANPAYALATFGRGIMFNFACGEVPTSVESFGTLKAVW